MQSSFTFADFCIPYDDKETWGDPMKTMIDYVVDTKDLAWDVKPFCAVDSMVLCQLVYEDFGDVVPGPEKARSSLSLEKAIQLRGIRQLIHGTLIPPKNESLLFAILESNRFRNLLLHAYVNDVDAEIQKQFSAITFSLPTGTRFVAFSGTDATLTGWKEDFNMTFLSPVPSQASAVAYLETVAKALPGPLIVGGHSKGGNLAVYASMHCQQDTRKRLRSIFNHDGPGFKEEVFSEPEFEAIAGMLQTTLPKASIVGMLLQHDNRYRVVESTSIGILQHNLFSWVVEGGDLRYASQLSPQAVLFGKTLNAWLVNLDEAQRERFVEYLFQVVGAANLTNLHDIRWGWRRAAKEAASVLKDIDAETKGFLMEIFSLLAESVKESLKEDFQQKIAGIVPAIAKAKEPGTVASRPGN